MKSIGDALMLRIPDPGVRVGLHHGPALERDGDYLGATVNLAARVSAHATGGEVLTTASTAALVAELRRSRVRSPRTPGLRNVREPVELVAAVRAGARPARSPAVDPVCQMAVDPGHAAGRLVYRDTAYFICTLTCAGHFARHPERFADRR